MTIQVGDPSAIADFQFDWSPQLPSGVDLAVDGVAHSVPSPLVLIIETTDVVNKRSTVRLSCVGAVHASIYTIKAVALLTNGERIPGSFTRRIFAGASA